MESWPHVHTLQGWYNYILWKAMTFTVIKNGSFKWELDLQCIISLAIQVVIPLLQHSKENWTIHLVIDFRELNNQIHQSEYPFSTIDEVLAYVLGVE